MIRGRLIKSEKETSKVISYSYDEGKERVMKNEDGKKTYYVNNLYEEDTKETRKFVYANDVKVASLTKLAGSSVEQQAFHHADHLGGSNVTTDSTGKVIETNDYYPYGDTRVEEKDKSYENDYMYTGKELDRDTGLYYYGSRYYDPLIGRFTGVDPVITTGGDKSGKSITDTLNNPQLMNGYSYTANNPLKYTDPTGEFLFTPMIIDPSGNIPGIAMGQKYDPKPMSTGEMITAVALGTLMTGGAIATYPLISSAIATGVNATSTAGELVLGGKAGKEVAGKMKKDTAKEIGQQVVKQTRQEIKNLADTSKMNIKSLSNAIKSHTNKINEHINKIANPAKYSKDWSKINTQQQIGRINHWEKEIKEFSKQLGRKLGILRDKLK